MRKIVFSGAISASIVLQAVAPAFAQDYSDDYNSAYQQNQRRQEYADRERRREADSDSAGPQSSLGLEDIAGAAAVAALLCIALCSDGKSTTKAPTTDANNGATRRPRLVYEPTYRVTSVPRWDVLNMRAGPGSENGLVGEIPSWGSGITVERCVRNAWGTPWCVANYDGQRGWVAARLLTAE